MNIIDKKSLNIDYYPEVAVIKKYKNLILIGTCEMTDWGNESGKGLFIFDTNEDKWTVLNVDNSNIVGNGVLDIFPAEETIWLGTTRGLSKYIPKTNNWTNYNILDGEILRDTTPIYSTSDLKYVIAYGNRNEVFKIRSLFENCFKVYLKDKYYAWINKKDVDKETDKTIFLKEYGKIYSEKDKKSQVLFKYDSAWLDNNYHFVKSTDDWYKIELSYGWVKAEDVRTRLKKIYPK